MAIKGFGINADAARLDGDLDTLARDMQQFARLGFDYVEIPVHGVGAMVGGRLLARRVDEVARLLGRFRFQYTVHAPNPLNLMDLENLAWQKMAMRESLEFAATIGADIVVYHSGRYIPEESFHLPAVWYGRPRDENGWTGQEPGPAEMRMRLGEQEALWELGEAAKSLGVTIAVENARPYLDGSPYCYGEHLPQLVEQVQAVGHPRVGIALDVGHAYLASRYYGTEFLGNIAVAAPYICHVHLHDNFGRPSGWLEKKQTELSATGRGDLHLPIGWGEIPAREVFDRLRQYSGVVVHEIRHCYQHWAGAALEWSRTMCGVPAEEVAVCR